MLDNDPSDTITIDRLPFDLSQSSNWTTFWKLIFGTAYQIRSPGKRSSKFLPISYNSVREEFNEKFKDAKASCMYIDRLSDLLSRSVFHALAS